jgi:GTP cyclohydrolase I
VSHRQALAVVVEAQHDCMNSRGIRACGTSLVRKAMSGAYRENAALRGEFLASLRRR